ncbi:MAG: hypothetical protein ACQEQD_03600 [Bacillota bacterium]
MKKSLILIAFLSLLLIFSGNSMAAENDFLDFDLENRQMVIGFDFPALGWANYNENGAIKGYRGINIALGYTDKRYMEAGIKQGEINPYWSWGTTELIKPYANIGVDYPFALNSETGGFWTVTGSIGARMNFNSSFENINAEVFPWIGGSYHF